MRRMDMPKKTAVIIGARGKIRSAVVKRLQDLDYEIDPTWLSNDRPDSTIATSYAKLPKGWTFVTRQTPGNRRPYA
jgi:hypothetical protein